MPSVTSRSIVLSICRLSNYVILLFSPVFLVRILDIESYGMYREFILYALLGASIITPGIRPNLLYFMPADKDNEQAFVQNTLLYLLISSTIVLSIVLLSKALLINFIRDDFIVLLVIYIFLFVNLDVAESYWLAKKRTDYVFYYTSILQITRISAVIITAYITHDVLSIIYSMIAIEAMKFTYLAFWWKNKYKHFIPFDRRISNTQLQFIIPLAGGVLLQSINQKFGGLFVATYMGTISLAIYSIGLYQIPVMEIVRSAVTDVIFPDMVNNSKTKGAGALRLWQHANIVFCFVVFPIFTIFWIFSEQFITLLFTEQYIESVPIFKIMLLMMILKCFEFGSPLRARNKNRYFLVGNILSISINIAFTLATYKSLGILAPVIGFLISEMLVSLYLSVVVMKVYALSAGKLFIWKRIAGITFATIVGTPLLYFGSTSKSLTTIMFMIISYLIVYYLIVRLFKIYEIEIVTEKLFTKLRSR